MLLFLHADTLLPRGFVNLIFETLMDRSVVAGAFRFRTDMDQLIMKISEGIVNIRSRFFHLPYGDQGLFVLRPVFESVGGFPDVPIAEDLFLVRQLKSLGAVRIAQGYAVTSARRWRTLGFLRTTLMNYLILAGCLLRISPIKLATFYAVRPKPPLSAKQSS